MSKIFPVTRARLNNWQRSGWVKPRAVLDSSRLTRLVYSASDAFVIGTLLELRANGHVFAKYRHAIEALRRPDCLTWKTCYLIIDKHRGHLCTKNQLPNAFLDFAGCAIVVDLTHILHRLKRRAATFQAEKLQAASISQVSHDNAYPLVHPLNLSALACQARPAHRTAVLRLTAELEARADSGKYPLASQPKSPRAIAYALGAALAEDPPPIDFVSRRVVVANALSQSLKGSRTFDVTSQGISVRLASFWKSVSQATSDAQAGHLKTPLRALIRDGTSEHWRLVERSLQPIIGKLTLAIRSEFSEHKLGIQSRRQLDKVEIRGHDRVWNRLASIIHTILAPYIFYAINEPIQLADRLGFLATALCDFIPLGKRKDGCWEILCD